MASAKDTFEAGTFLAMSFACGTWRGINLSVPATAGPDYTYPHDRQHYTLPADAQHYQLPLDRQHYTIIRN